MSDVYVPSAMKGKKRKDLTLQDCVYLLLRRGRYMTFWEIQDLVKAKTNKFYSENSISAAIRALRLEGSRSYYELQPYGEVVVKRRKARSKAYEYKLADGAMIRSRNGI